MTLQAAICSMAATGTIGGTTGLKRYHHWEKRCCLAQRWFAADIIFEEDGNDVLTGRVGATCLKAGTARTDFTIISLARDLLRHSRRCQRFQLRWRQESIFPLLMQLVLVIIRLSSRPNSHLLGYIDRNVVVGSSSRVGHGVSLP